MVVQQWYWSCHLEWLFDEDCAVESSEVYLSYYLGWKSKPVGENTVVFRTEEVKHGLEAVRKGGWDQALKMEATSFCETLAKWNVVPK
jgi:hypothetical protein